MHKWITTFDGPVRTIDESSQSIQGAPKMPKQGLTEIVCIIDKSGSMDSVRDDSIGGFNTFLKGQRELPGEALFTLTLFDTDYTVIHNGVPIAEVPELTSDTYIPGGMTALLDAMGRTIDKVGQRLAETDEDDRPENVIVAILTDGQENSSTEYTRDQVMASVKQQQDEWSWEFMYLGANQDAVYEGGRLGISAARSRNYVADSDGTSKVYQEMSMEVQYLRMPEYSPDESEDE
jgi:uncharacterized protein YegL